MFADHVALLMRIVIQVVKLFLRRAGTQLALRIDVAVDLPGEADFAEAVAESARALRADVNPRAGTQCEIVSTMPRRNAWPSPRTAA